MGRRGTDTGGLEAPAGAWEAVRRALARLVARPQVREITPGGRDLPVRIHATEAVGALAASAGVGEDGWNRPAAIRAVPIPQTQAGGRDRNLLPAVRVAAGDRAIAVPDCRALPSVSAEGCRVEAAALIRPAETADLPPEFLALPSSPVRVQGRPLLAAPPGKAWKIPRLATPRVNGIRIPRPSAPTIRWGGDAVLSRIALTRRGRETPPGLTPDTAFVAERRRLAEAAGLPVEDVTLLGVYSQVPILAVSRIVVEDEGRGLRLWLKPDVLRGKGKGRLITLLVGRRSDGKMLQAAL